MYNLSHILSKAACETTRLCWKQQTKPVSAVPGNPGTELWDPMTHTMQQDCLVTGCWGRADGSTRAVCSPQVAVTHTAPWVCPPEPDVPPLWHLGSGSQTHPGTEWISQTTRLLCDNPQAKNPPQQMVELNGPSSSAVLEKRVAGLGWHLSPALPQPETAACFTPPSALHLQRHSANQMGKKGRVMVALKRKLQSNNSEKIAIKSILEIIHFYWLLWLFRLWSALWICTWF